MDRQQAIERLKVTGISDERAGQVIDAVAAKNVDLGWFVDNVDQGEFTVTQDSRANISPDDIAGMAQSEYKGHVEGVVTGRDAPTSSSDQKGVVQAATATAASDQAVSQIKGGDVNGAITTLTALSSGILGSNQIPSEVLQLTGGKPLDQQHLNQAISIYNQANPSDQLKDNDAAGFYQRVQFNAPGALDAIGRVSEGSTKTVFSVWDPTSRSMKDVPVRSEQIVATVAQTPEGLHYLSQSVAAATRTGGLVPWQIVHAATEMQGGEKAASTDRVKLENANRNIDPGDFTGPRRNTGSDSIADQLQKYVLLYGDPLLAMVALKDPQLADAIYNQGSATPDQARKVQQVFLDAGLGTDPASSLAKQGLAVDLAKLNALLGGSGGSGSGGGGSTTKVTLPDPEQLKSAARQLYEAWFAREPNDSELAAFVSDINSKVVGEAQATGAAAGKSNPFKSQPAPGPTNTVQTSQSTDPQSELEAQLRGSSEYGQLFGNKPTGVSETDYANQFRQSGASFLGGQLPNSDAVRIGMETGNPEDTLRVLQGDASSLGNSTFQQRIARAAQAIAQVT